MVKLPEVEALEVRKRLLVARSEIYRQLIATDCQEIDASTRWLQKGVALLRRTLPLMILAAPVAKLLLQRRGVSLRRISFRGLTTQALAGWRLFKRVQPLLHRWRAARARAAQSQSFRG